MADLSLVLACPSAAGALQAIEREMLANRETRFTASSLLEALGEEFGDDMGTLEQVLAMIGRRENDGRAAVRLVTSLFGVERALIVKRLLSESEGGNHG